MIEFPINESVPIYYIVFLSILSVQIKCKRRRKTNIYLHGGFSREGMHIFRNLLFCNDYMNANILSAPVT